MNHAIGAAITDSSQDFADHVWPHIAHMMGGGTFVPVETVMQSQVAEDLDMIAGIDLLHYPESGGIRGVASRVQYCDPAWTGKYPWDTFTIRRTRPTQRMTEWDKRLRAVESGGALLYPYLTVQAYLMDRGVGPLVSAAVVRTADLITYVRDNGADVRTVKGGTTMFVIPWIHLEDVGVQIRTVHL
jgi:hypothetical protein